MPSVVRALPVRLAEPLPPAVLALLADFRLLLNEVIRQALTAGVTSRGTLSRFARTRALEHGITGSHAVVAAGLAVSIVKAHRKRLRHGLPSRPPYVRTAFLRADDSSFHLNVDTGVVRISLRPGVWSSFVLELAQYHRDTLAHPGFRIKQLHVLPDRAVLFLERDVPEPYVPTAIVALDTNERSLDGVAIDEHRTQAARIRFPELSLIQHRHRSRARGLARKKATDRRVGRRLLRREGRREHDRITSRLHVLTKTLVKTAEQHHAALVLEDLSKMPRPRRPRGRFRRSSWRRSRGGPIGTGPAARKLRRRLSSWPRGELHRQLAYKAAEHGVPIILVNPFRTSTTCPRCGAYTAPRSRVRTTFDCSACGWQLDRQLNAGANVGRIALRDIVELGGLRLDLDALSREARRPRYPFRRVGRARAERTEGEGSTRLAGLPTALR